jgi:hypothetical protein
LFREHHRVPLDDLDSTTGLPIYRPPTFQQMATFWKVPEDTIRWWWNNQHTILESKSGTRQANTQWICMWLEMEKKLYTKFVQRRAAGIIVRRSWFQRESRKLWVETYLGVLMLFVITALVADCNQHSRTNLALYTALLLLLLSLALDSCIRTTN